MLDKICKYHNDWIRIAYSFLNNKEDAEDVVQDMYIKLDRLNIELYNKKYGDDINKGYFYTVIRNLSLDFIKKKSVNYHIDIDQIQLEEIDNCDKEECFNKLIYKIHEEINKWDYYDRTLFECYMYSGLSYRDMANGSQKDARLISNTMKLNDKAISNGIGITTRAVSYSIKKSMNKLKEKFGEDFEDYFNNDYDKI